MCFVLIWEQTVTCATYSINWLVFITEMKSVYCAVRTGSLNKVVCAFVLKGLITEIWAPCLFIYIIQSAVTAQFIFNLVSRWIWALVLHVPGCFTPWREPRYLRLGLTFRFGNRNIALRNASQYLDCPSDAQILEFQESHYWIAFTCKT